MTRRMIAEIGGAMMALATVLMVRVPFEFHAGSAHFPAGQYQIDTESSPGVVRLQSAAHRAGATILVSPARTGQTFRAGHVVFRRYGSDVFLSEVWRPGDRLGAEIRRSRKERELAQADAGPGAVIRLAVSEAE